MSYRLRSSTCKPFSSRLVRKVHEPSEHPMKPCTILHRFNNNSKISSTREPQALSFLKRCSFSKSLSEFQEAAPKKWLLEAAKDIMDAGLTGHLRGGQGEGEGEGGGG